MYGAIIGDIVGSRFEFDRGGKTKNFEFFTKEDDFTDDSVMTIAVADGLFRAGKNATTDEIRKAVIISMKHWGRLFPHAGYGARFINWLFSDSNPKPYGSFGNGSAMRVSAAGWLYDSLERTREVARLTSDVTHNHREGIKGAECTASVIFMARTGSTKDEIRTYVDREFGYDLSETLDQMRERHEHIETCQDSLPKALKSFFEGDSFEDVVRNAVSLGGDTDTLAAIAGSMAEAMYGIPMKYMIKMYEYIPKEFHDVLNFFNSLTIEKKEIADYCEKNYYIKLAVEDLHENKDMDHFINLLNVIIKRLLEDGETIMPMIDVNNTFEKAVENGILGKICQFEEDVRLRFDKMVDEDGKFWTPLFTDEEECNRQPTPNIRVNVPIIDILAEGLNCEEREGVVINPFGKSFKLTKDTLAHIRKFHEKALEEKCRMNNNDN